MEYKGAQRRRPLRFPAWSSLRSTRRPPEPYPLYYSGSGARSGLALTRYLKQTGVVVSMGHSCATYEQAMLAIANGASSMTHVYNGMTAFTHRKPGLVGAASG